LLVEALALITVVVALVVIGHPQGHLGAAQAQKQHCLCVWELLIQSQ
jgi:hypothetical protein